VGVGGVRWVGGRGLCMCVCFEIVLVYARKGDMSELAHPDIAWSIHALYCMYALYCMCVHFVFCIGLHGPLTCCNICIGF